MNNKPKTQNNFFNKPIGEFVTIDKNTYHACQKGNGRNTLVFLAGEAVPCPSLDFKPLYSLLASKFKIVVLEKAGYGLSDITSDPSDIATLVARNRQILKALSIAPPYILVPHSYSGLEAIYWSQKHKSEIKAIIALDMTIPSIAKIAKTPPQIKLAIGLSLIFKKIKITKKQAIKLTKKLPSFDHPSLSDHDKMIYFNLIKNRFMTINMAKEIILLKSNAAIVDSGKTPTDLPILFFSSDLIDAAKNANKTPSDLLQLQKDFVSNFSTNQHTILDCDHFVHAHKSNQIARQITAFIDTVFG
ncbi:MAG: alpha/beta hydrolase [Firmicutes bacterium]|nr:alpha/beta hydrolase [Bacillota bacterium]